ncbi:hypothetical protein BGZ49_000469 [Haplosporangium sp. Z 27]|nr:hypothetical protein BGZ49_000469 [Haplosporangium sp. Z 27]
MGFARKIAGVTKDNKVYETLESRFGMFLNSNTQGAQFAVQCVGIASTTHMELAGDAEMDESIDDVYMDELDTPARALDETEVAEDKALFRKSLEQDRSGEVLMALTNDSETPASRLQHAALAVLDAVKIEKMKQHQQEDHTSLEHLASESEVEEEEDYSEIHGDHSGQYDGPYDKDNDIDSSDEEPKYASVDEIPLSNLATSDSGSSSWGFSKGLLKGAIRRVVKPSVMFNSNGSTDSFRTLSSRPQIYSNSKADLSMTSISSYTPRKPPMGINRTESDASGSNVVYEDLGEGVYPTVHVYSKPGGHFNGTIRMSNEEVETFRRQAGNDIKGAIGRHPKFLKLHAHHQDMATPANGIVNLIDPEGISVISDIDDTIKETNVTAGKRIILRNTFLREMQEVEGMANVYRKWWNQGAAVHYVSNSPWQLIPTLLDFFHTHMFPPGSAHLKVYDSNVLKTYFTAPGENKRRSIREILADFPDRKFILVGDSGEIDLEIYTEIAIENPTQIFRIFIRDITTARLKEISKAGADRGGRSFSSSLKAPISAVTTGFGFFGGKGSVPSASFPENNRSTPNLSVPVSVSPRSEDGTQTDIDIPFLSSPDELPGDEMVKKSKLFNLNSSNASSSQLEPTSASTSTSTSAFNSPTSSPRLQAKQFSAGIKSATSLLSSAFRKSSISGSSSKKSGGRSVSVSPLASEIVSDGYPFPTTGSPISVQSGSTSGDGSNVSDNHDDELENYRPQGQYLNGDATHFNFTKEMFEGHEQAIAKHKKQQFKQRPSRSNTFSFSSPALFGSSPGATPSESYGNTPVQSPMRSPRLQAQPIRGQPTTLSSSYSNEAAASSGSLSTSMSSHFSITKNPLEIWQDRVIQCKRRLPHGVTLTLFESAEELERCILVQEMFEKYPKSRQEKKKNVGDISSSGGGGAIDVKDEEFEHVDAFNSTENSSAFNSGDESFEDSMSSVECIDHSLIDQDVVDRNCAISA